MRRLYGPITSPRGTTTSWPWSVTRQSATLWPVTSSTLTPFGTVSFSSRTAVCRTLKSTVSVPSSSPSATAIRVLVSA